MCFVQITLQEALLAVKFICTAICTGIYNILWSIFVWKPPSVIGCVNPVIPLLLYGWGLIPMDEVGFLVYNAVWMSLIPIGVWEHRSRVEN